MYLKYALCAATALSVLGTTGAIAETITIATVNNGDMIRMQGLTDDFTAKTGHKVEWVTLEENVLRQRVTTDISAKGGQFDIMTIGMYETPIWAKNGWLVAMDDLPADYDIDDILPAMRGGLSFDGTMYAAPFYGESSMIMYRTDLMEAAGMTMPDAPTWDFVAEAARAMTDKEKEIYGICLRGKAGWGENMAFLTATSNAFGARWFDEEWKPQFDSEAWSKTLNFYIKLMNEAGPPGASNNGFNENLSLFQQGLCGMWIDATVAASFVTNPNDSDRGGFKVGFALAPDTWSRQVRSNWLWAWALAIPGRDAAGRCGSFKEFIEWATSSDYIELGGSRTKVGPMSRRVRGPRCMRTRKLHLGHSLRPDDAGLASCRPIRPTPTVEPSSLRGHPVRGHSGVRRHRVRSQPGILGSFYAGQQTV